MLQQKLSQVQFYFFPDYPVFSGKLSRRNSLVQTKEVTALFFRTGRELISMQI